MLVQEIMKLIWTSDKKPTLREVALDILGQSS
jgi:hypothetical protein